MGGVFIAPNPKRINTRINAEGEVVSITVTGGEPEIEKTKEEKIAELKAKLEELENESI